MQPYSRNQFDFPRSRQQGALQVVAGLEDGAQASGRPSGLSLDERAVTTVGVVALTLLIAGLLLNSCWPVLWAILSVPFVLLARLPNQFRRLMSSGYFGFMALFVVLPNRSTLPLLSHLLS
jgi:hypothetical protein